jgi:uncharacterized protein
MNKKLLNLIVLAALMLALLPAATFAAPAEPVAVVCEKEYTVVAGDWLAKLAEQFYTDKTLYTAIVEATNQKHATDASFAQITNPDALEAGMKLCIVDAATAKTLAAAAAPKVVQKDGYTEEKVNLDNGIVGTLAIPDKAKDAPAVLLLHGFASSRDEVGDMYKNLAGSLAKEGVASLRIDFRGWGESAGDMQDSTIHGMVDDTQTAYNFLAKQDFVDAKRIGVVGFSLGGGVAIVSGAQNPTWYKSMVLWSSVGDLKPDFVEDLGGWAFDKAKNDGMVILDLGFRTVWLKNSFFTGLEEYKLQDLIKQYPGAFLAIAGSEDFSAKYVKGFVDSLSGSPKESSIIKGADHIYGVLTEDQTMANSVIDQTAKWFAKTL